ncbi:MAG: DNA mismatch repair endonuclease MutL [Elusimicrobia bacterium]|nr:DNA mismatch repair endonuclease MutL [Elusimicrobiota bacterium]
MEEAAVSAIKRLPDDVASRIAAGEVIERPASVLKELLENSLDAGAAKIHIESTGAGRGLLRVSDDGAGIAAADCELAFERHTTSKIASLEDLERLATFGFRGEALFSIAAVSRTTLSSCRKGSKKGHSVRAEGGRIKASHEAPPVSGTTIEVRDLFFNTPARAKFLKSDASEKGHLAHVVEEAALANPTVTFIYKSEGRIALRFDAPRADGIEAHRSRVCEVLGGDWSDGLLAAEETRSGLTTRAFLAPADNLAASRSQQFCFINRRPVTSRLIQQTLYRAYEPFRSRDRHPVAVVFLELPPDQFDVNVHPAKREVRFRGERMLFEALTGMFSSMLLKAKGIPTVDRFRLSAPLRPEGERYGSGSSAGPDRPIPAPSLASSDANAYPAADAAELFEKWVGLDAAAPAAPSQRWYSPPFTFLGQIERSYLVFDASGGLLVVDQHAAQERILFERFLEEIESGALKSQPLMLPLPIELPASRIQHVLSRRERLKRIGFDVEGFGKTTLHVTAAPAIFKKAGDLKEMVERLLESVETESGAAKDVQHHAVATIACKAAVKAHDPLGAKEALRLLEDLKACRDGTCCPHGRPAMIFLNRDELARRFKRPGAPPL